MAKFVDSAAQEARFPAVRRAKDDVGILNIPVHAEMKRVIGRFEETSHECMVSPLMLIAAGGVRSGLAMLHQDFCFHKFLPEF